VRRPCLCIPQRDDVAIQIFDLDRATWFDLGRGAAMLVTKRSAPGVPDVRRLLRDAQYPARTMSIADPDGNPIHLSY
jgi:hypothetical protein